MKEHYFKQKNYGVDRLLNRQLYVDVATQPIREEHRILRASSKASLLSLDTDFSLNNEMEQRRLEANREFSKGYWDKLEEKLPHDLLLKRQLFIERAVRSIREKHRILRDSLRGCTLSLDTEILLNNSVEQKRRKANLEFCKRYGLLKKGCSR